MQRIWDPSITQRLCWSACEPVSGRPYAVRGEGFQSGRGCENCPHPALRADSWLPGTATSAPHICPMFWDIRNNLIWCEVNFCSYETGIIMSIIHDLWKDWQACEIRFCSWAHPGVSGCVFLTEFGVLPVAGACWWTADATFVTHFYFAASPRSLVPRLDDSPSCLSQFGQLSAPDSGAAIYWSFRFAHITDIDKQAQSSFLGCLSCVRCLDLISEDIWEPLATVLAPSKLRRS